MSTKDKASNREELTDIAQMQRRRLERVVDPIKYMLSVQATDYPHRMRADFQAFEKQKLR